MQLNRRKKNTFSLFAIFHFYLFSVYEKGKGLWNPLMNNEERYKFLGIQQQHSTSNIGYPFCIIVDAKRRRSGERMKMRVAQPLQLAHLLLRW